MNKIFVCYLFTCFDHHENIKKFIEHYKKYNSGIEHSLLICLKMLKKKDVLLIKNYLKNINYIEFIDPIETNDYDFGSYKRVCMLYPNKQILFLNSHSYPICDNWLSKLAENSDENSLIGTSASNESLLNSVILKKKYKIFSYILKKIYYKKIFNPFPNPHIRTSSFLVNSNIFLNYINKKKILSKFDTWVIESGKNSLSNHFKKMNYKIYVVNSDGERFFEKNWQFSETYNFLQTSKSIISDKHTRKYELLNEDDKIISRIKVWGN